MLYKCGNCGHGIPDTALRASVDEPSGATVCPSCGTRVERQVANYPLLGIAGAAFIGAQILRDRYEIGTVLYAMLLLVGVVSFVAFFALGHRGKVLKPVSGRER